MTQDDIIRMANEACQPHQILNTDLEFLERFFHLAFAAGAAHEREVCAKVCDEWYENRGLYGVDALARAIRNRGDK